MSSVLKEILENVEALRRCGVQKIEADGEKVVLEFGEAPAPIPSVLSEKTESGPAREKAKMPTMNELALAHTRGR